jgi:hypothetical protein
MCCSFYQLIQKTILFSVIKSKSFYLSKILPITEPGWRITPPTPLQTRTLQFSRIRFLCIYVSLSVANLSLLCYAAKFRLPFMVSPSKPMVSFSCSENTGRLPFPSSARSDCTSPTTNGTMKLL